MHTLEKEKLYAPDFFLASTTEKTTVGAGKNVSFAYPGKRNALCAKIFLTSTAVFSAVDAGKNGPVPTGYFSLPEAGKKPGEECERTGFFNSVQAV